MKRFFWPEKMSPVFLKPASSFVLGTFAAWADLTWQPLMNRNTFCAMRTDPHTA